MEGASDRRLSGEYLTETWLPSVRAGIRQMGHFAISVRAMLTRKWRPTGIGHVRLDALDPPTLDAPSNT